MEQNMTSSSETRLLSLGKTENGNLPVTTRAAGAWPYFADDEIEAAVRVLRSGNVNYWTGQEGRQFETEFAASTGCKYAVALANGTAALDRKSTRLNSSHLGISY